MAAIDQPLSNSSTALIRSQILLSRSRLCCVLSWVRSVSLKKIMPNILHVKPNFYQATSSVTIGISLKKCLSVENRPLAQLKCLMHNLPFYKEWEDAEVQEDKKT